MDGLQRLSLESFSPCSACSNFAVVEGGGFCFLKKRNVDDVYTFLLNMCATQFPLEAK